MTDLAFSIISSTAILVLFKSFEERDIPLFHAIIINYAVAFSLGMAVNHGTDGIVAADFFRAPWTGPAAGLGICLITMFFVIGISTQKAGISITTVAAKISVVIPMLFSIFYYGESMTWIKAAGIGLALTGLACTVVRPEKSGAGDSGWYLPLILFTGLGGMDALVKFVQHEYVSDAASAAFTGATFFFAFCTGLAVCLFRQISLSGFLKPRVVVAGILLGAANFGSIFFIINALNSGVLDSAVLFGINSISVMALSVFCGLIFFRERLSPLNRAGIGMAIAAILLFTRA